MTVFSDTWNATYEGLPSDNENISLGANRIRDLKVNVRERIAVDHSFNGDTLDGLHTHSQYIPQGADPPAVNPLGIVYTKLMSSGSTELFYEYNNGIVIQITSGGALNTSPFPSGTSMLFAQAVPPVGWVQVGNNDELIRVVNDSSGGGTGGSWTISGTSVATSTGTSTTTTTSTVLNSLGLSTTITGVNMSLSMNSITLAAGNLPGHTHNVTISPFATSGQRATGSAGIDWRQDFGGSLTFASDTGSGLNDTPFTPSGSVSFVSGSASTGVTSSSLSSTSSSGSTSTSTSSFSNDGTWRPAYLNVLRAQKT